MLRRTKVRVAAEMQARTDQRIATLLSTPSKSPPARHSSGPIRYTLPSTKAERSRAIFLKRDIPTHIDAPEIHAELNDLMAIRQQFQEDKEEAVQDGNETNERLAQEKCDKCNARMYAVYDLYLKGEADDEGSSVSPSSSWNVQRNDSNQHFVGIDDLPMPVVFGQVGEEQHTRHVSPKQLGLQSPGSHAIDASFCQPFQIWFGYLDQEQSVRVWDEMSLLHLHASAYSWIVQTFAGTYSEELVTLIRYAKQLYQSDVCLPRTGAVVDIPLHDNDVLEVIVKRPGPVPRRARDSNDEDFDTLNPHQDDTRRSIDRRFHPTHHGDAASEVRAANDKSFDKLRQNFKLPKF